MSIKLSDDNLERLQYYLEGTCQTIHQAMSALELDGYDENIVLDQILNPPHPVEECQECGWWFEAGDLVRENEDDCGFCEQCRLDEEE